MILHNVPNASAFPLSYLSIIKLAGNSGKSVIEPGCEYEDNEPFPLSITTELGRLSCSLGGP